MSRGPQKAGGAQPRSGAPVKTNVKLQIKKKEEASVKSLCAKLQVQWGNQSVEDAQMHARESGEKWRRAREQSLDAKYLAMEAVYALYLMAVHRNELNELLEGYKEQGIRVVKSAHPLTSIVRAIISRKRDVANRWGTALRYALQSRTKPENLSGFLKKKGGIEKCVDKFRALSAKTNNINTRFTHKGAVLSKKAKLQLAEHMKKQEDQLLQARMRLSRNGKLVVVECTSIKTNLHQEVLLKPSRA